MQQYSHDYTKVAEAESHLYAAQQLNAHDDPIEAWKHINDARQLLQQYLAQDNMIPDDDVESGWVCYSEAQAVLDDLRKRIGENTPRSVSGGSSAGTSSPRTDRHGQIDRRYLAQVTDGADPSNPLYGKIAVLSGTYEQIHMERDEVAEAIQRLGAKLNRSVSRTMQVFIMGNKVGPAKLAEVEQLRAEGHDIRIISQLEFKEIVNTYINN